MRDVVGDARGVGPVLLASSVVGLVDERELAPALAWHELVERAGGVEGLGRGVVEQPALDVGQVRQVHVRGRAWELRAG